MQWGIKKILNWRKKRKNFADHKRRQIWEDFATAIAGDDGW